MLHTTLTVLAAANTTEKTLGVPSTAFFGLLGVLVGAVIATGGDLALEKVRAKHDDEREERADRVQLVTAARLVDAELRSLLTLLQVSELRGEWWPTAYGEVPRAAFDQNQNVLAAGLSPAEWSAVADAYYRLGILVLHFNEETYGRPHSFAALPFEKPGYAKDMGGQTLQLHIARRALRDYAEPIDADALESNTASELHAESLAIVAKRIGEDLPDYVVEPGEERSVASGG